MGNLVDAFAQFAVAEPDLATKHTVPADKGGALRAGVHGFVEVIDRQAVGPKLCRSLQPSLRQPNLHCLLPTSWALPARPSLRLPPGRATARLSPPWSGRRSRSRSGR